MNQETNEHKTNKQANKQTNKQATWLRILLQNVVIAKIPKKFPPFYSVWNEWVSFNLQLITICTNVNHVAMFNRKRHLIWKHSCYKLEPHLTV